MKNVRVLALILGVTCLLVALFIVLLASRMQDVGASIFLLAGGMWLCIRGYPKIRSSRRRIRLLWAFGGATVLLAIASGVLLYPDYSFSWPLAISSILVLATALGTIWTWKKRRTSSGKYLDSYFTE